MRVPSAGRRRRSAAIAAAPACAVALLVQSRVPGRRRAAPRAAAPRGLDDAGYFAVADRLQRRLDSLWNARLGRYEPGPGAAVTEVNADLLLVHSVAALHGHHGPARADARARAIARFLVRPGGLGRAAAARRRSAGHRPGLARRRRARRTGTSSSTPRPSTGSSTPTSRATRSASTAARSRASATRSTASPRAATGAGRRCGSTRSTGTATMFAADAVVNGDRHALADGHGAATSRASSPASHRHGREGRQPRPGPALPLPPAQGLRARLERRLGRVREHRPELLALLRPGARRRHAPARAARPAARLGAARDRRLLDPQRLPELGHRARLPPLAPAQEGRRWRSSR